MNTNQMPPQMAQMPQIQEKEYCYITYYWSIIPQSVNNIMQTINKIRSQFKISNIYFNISSWGWDTSAWISLYNYLKALPENIITHNMGSVDSIANVIFLAWDKRYSSPHSSFLFHWVTAQTNWPISLWLSQLKENLSRMESEHKKIAWIITDRTELKEDEVLEFFNAWQAKDNDFAKEKLIIDDIRDIPTPSETNSINITIPAVW